MALRRLVDSSEPAIVFSSLIRLCVPAFSDACSVDIIEGGRVRYRIDYPQRPARATAARATSTPATSAPAASAPATSAPATSAPVIMDARHQLSTTFASELAGWPSYTGVLTSRWSTHRPTDDDADRAADLVEHAIEMIRRERLADPIRSALAVFTTSEAQHRVR